MGYFHDVVLGVKSLGFFSVVVRLASFGFSMIPLFFVLLKD